MKTGLMVGLGETTAELESTIMDIRAAGTEILTLGQYLQPTRDHLTVDRFVHPDEFARLRDFALGLGFSHCEFATGSEVKALEDRGIDVLVATGTGDRRRRHDFRPEPKKKPPKEPKAEWVRRMRKKLAQEDNRKTYGLRKQTVEPVFGIVKHVLGFRQFLLRGLPKVNGEWTLVTLAYNCKRLHRLMAA